MTKYVCDAIHHDANEANPHVIQGDARRAFFPPDATWWTTIDSERTASALAPQWSRYWGKSPLSHRGLARKSPPSSGGPRSDGANSAGEASRPVPCGEHVLAIGQPNRVLAGAILFLARTRTLRKHRAGAGLARLTDARAGRLVSPPYFGLWWRGGLTSSPSGHC